MTKQETETKIEHPTIITVYGLIDPFSHHVMYVGRTTWPVDARISRHMTEARFFDGVNHHRTRKHDWLSQLNSLGLKPLWIALAQTGDDDDASRLERAFIAAFEHTATNKRRGGDGHKKKHTEMAKANMRRAKAIKRSERYEETTTTRGSDVARIEL